LTLVLPLFPLRKALAQVYDDATHSSRQNRASVTGGASALPHRHARPPATGVESPGGLRSVAEDQPGGVSGPHGPGEVDRLPAAVLVDVFADQHRGV
jgi:hypothetical protein